MRKEPGYEPPSPFLAIRTKFRGNGSSDGEVDDRVADIILRVRRRPPGERTTLGCRHSARALARELPAAAPRLCVEIAVELVRAGERQFAYELVHAARGAIEALDGADLEAMAVGLDDWGPVDHFATYVAGPAWREGRVSGPFIHRWLTSDDRWLRRAAVVATVALNSKARGGAGDAPRTIRVCRAVVDDRDDMVVKALSWALRELAKRDRRAVEQFLNSYDSRMAPRVRREVGSKLRTGLKNPRPR